MCDSIPVSVTILTKNSAEHLEKCLAALTRFDEVVILDGGSTDKTIEIAQTFPNVRLFHSEFIGFGALKNLAASFAENDWIFSLDSDEIFSQELVETLANLKLPSNEVGIVHRKNFYNGRLIDGCGWQNDFVVRFYNKNQTRFSDKTVHESIVTKDSRIISLKGFLEHHPYKNAAGLLDKMQFYSTLYAAENRFRKRATVLKSCAAGISALIKSYFFGKGIFYGAEGLLISVSNAGGAFYKYMKLREANKHLRVSLIITTYNREDALEATLQSALAQTALPDEIIIADDGSRSATKELIERYQKKSPISIIHCRQPDKGFRAAQIRNKSIAAATGEYIIIVDGDLILHPEFVKDHKTHAHRNNFIQGSRAWLSEAKTKNELAKNNAAAPPSIFAVGNRANAVHSRFLSKLFSKNVNYERGVKSCNMSFWRDDCLLVNGFNEDFTGWGREDSEFVVRLLNNNIKRINLRFGAITYHLFHPHNSRENLSRNDSILQKTIEEKLTRCENGITKSMREEKI
ncbi:MAG: glycosyltransferase family 2 protein [Pyrinomonadaceae bacterium]